MSCSTPYIINITWDGTSFSGGTGGDVPSTSDCISFALNDTSGTGDHITGVEFFPSQGAYRQGQSFSPGYLDLPGSTSDGGATWKIEFSSAATPRVNIYYKLFTSSSTGEHDYDPLMTIEPRS